MIGIVATLMAVPVAVVGSAAGPYDDPKAWALPILAALTALARVSWPGARADGPPARALTWTAIGYLGWFVLATATSVAPGQSLVGSFGRGMGLLTIASGPVIFLLVRAECRAPAAARLIVDSALLGSVPVCLLALAQAAGWDPLPRSWDPAVAELRVRSTFGQHIFLGSYLAVLVPLAAARLGWAWSSRAAGQDEPAALPVDAVAVGGGWVLGVLGAAALASRWGPLWWALLPWGILGAATWGRAYRGRWAGMRGRPVVLIFGGIVAMQVLVMVLSAARGPLLGMMFGLSVAGVLLVVRHRAWRVLALAGGAAATLAALLALLVATGAPLGPLAKVAVLGRLGQMADASPGTPVAFRLDVWRGILEAWGRQMRGEQIVPATDPLIRSAIGFGPETQLLTLSQITLPAVLGREAEGAGWRAQYLVDRAHNVLLDQLVTGGLVAVGLWLGVVVCLLAAGLGRLRRARSGEEAAFRIGCLGAVLAHVAEGQVGIVTPMPLALFWAGAALLVSAPWPGAGRDSEASRIRSRTPAARAVSALVAVILVAGVGWVGTRWLLASIAYAEGTRRHIAGQTDLAYVEFERAGALTPWLPLVAEARASSALRLAGREADPARRLEILDRGEAALAAARRHAPGSAGSWALSAQIALARVRAGARGGLQASLDAFERAVSLSPRDPQLMAQWGWAWLEARDPVRARQAAEAAIALPGGRREWLAWAVLSASARDLGDHETARVAGRSARRLAPPEARALLGGLP